MWALILRARRLGYRVAVHRASQQEGKLWDSEVARTGLPAVENGNAENAGGGMRAVDMLDRSTPRFH
jgi:hypothetical protein